MAHVVAAARGDGMVGAPMNHLLDTHDRLLHLAGARTGHHEHVADDHVFGVRLATVDDEPATSSATRERWDAMLCGGLSMCWRRTSARVQCRLRHSPWLGGSSWP